VIVQVFASDDFRRHWDRLDAFEGPEYQRVEVPVETADGVVTAWLYALKDEPR
jgi:gamma-glutamylcyclotransferase (GGCT)/AIG2-like uncharacterized protein YtfP